MQSMDTGSEFTTNEALVEAFEGLTIAAGAFGHREHIRLAWTYLQRMPVEAVLVKTREGLQRFAAHHGAHDLYNETITWAFVLLIHDRMRRGPDGETWDAFAARCSALFDDKPSILERYYDRETLVSPHAKATFVWPDRDIPTRAPLGE